MRGNLFGGNRSGFWIKLLLSMNPSEENGNVEIDQMKRARSRWSLWLTAHYFIKFVWKMPTIMFECLKKTRQIDPMCSLFRWNNFHWRNLLHEKASEQNVVNTWVNNMNQQRKIQVVDVNSIKWWCKHNAYANTTDMIKSQQSWPRLYCVVHIHSIQMHLG